MDLNQLFHHHQMALMAVSKAQRDGDAPPDFELPHYYAKRINDYRELRGLLGDAEAITRMSESRLNESTSQPRIGAAAAAFVGDALVAELLIQKALDRSKGEIDPDAPGNGDVPPIDIGVVLLAIGRDFYRSLGVEGDALGETRIDLAAQCSAWEGEGGSLRPSDPDEEEGIARTYVEQYTVGRHRYSSIVDAKAAALRQREALRTPGAGT